jgi:hypothetical protein
MSQRPGLSTASGQVPAGAGRSLALRAPPGRQRLATGLLFGVEPTDPPTFVAVAALLCAVALAACYVPARRAMRLDPVAALRHE